MLAEAEPYAAPLPPIEIPEDILFLPPLPPELPIGEPEPESMPGYIVVPDPEPSPKDTPFTPDGSGTVIDNAMEPNNREFFTITAEDGSIFYLVIDRMRSNENVYFLNAVTVDGLMSLAQGESATLGTFPNPEPLPLPIEPDPAPEIDPEPVLPEDSGLNRGPILIVLLVVLGVGGAGYYIKILKPKRQADDLEEEYEGGSDGPGDYNEADRVYDDYDDEVGK